MMNDDTRKPSTSWAVVNKDGEIEHSDDGRSSSSGSSEYVHLDGTDEAVSYYHLSRGSSSSPELLEPECDGSVPPSDVTAAVVLGFSQDSSPVCDVPGDWAGSSQSVEASNTPKSAEEPDVVAGSSCDVSGRDQDEDESHLDEVSDETTELITEKEVGSDNEVSSIEVLSIPSDGNDSGDGFSDATDREKGEPRSDGVEGAADLFRSVSMDNAAEEEAREPSFADEDAEMVDSAQMDWLPLDEASSSLTSLPRTPPREPWRQCSTESDSDQSDFVKLSPSRSAEGSTASPCTGAGGRGDRMEASTSSALTTSGSSISSSFRFVRPVLPAPPLISRPQHPVLLERPHYQYQPQQLRHPDEEDDSGSLPPADVDDRCESDISGVADDSDADLSSATFMGALPLTAGNVVRSYKHRPNNSLNATLNVLALLALFTAVGIGMGHYMGSSREINLRQQRLAKMKSLQDDYLMCLRQMDVHKAKAAITDEQKIAAVTGVWKSKFEELIIEKVELEGVIRALNDKMAADIKEAQDEVWRHQEEIIETAAPLAPRPVAHDNQKAALQQENRELKDSLEVVQLQLSQTEGTLHDVLEQNHATMAKLALQGTGVEELLALKDRLNLMATENAELKTIVAKMRYTEPLGRDTVREGGETTLKSEVNLLANEIADLRTVVGRLRYGLQAERDKEGPSTEEQIVTGDLAEEASTEEQIVTGDQPRGGVGEGTTTKGSEEGGGAAQPEGAIPPTFLGCFTLLVPPLSPLSDLANISAPAALENLTASARDYLLFLQNATADGEFSRAFSAKWEELKGLAGSAASSVSAEKVSSVVNDIRVLLRDRWEQRFDGDLGDGATAKTWSEWSGAVSNASAETFRSFYDKTKDNVAKLSQQVKKTLKKVKNISSKVLAKDQSLKTIGSSVEKNIEDFGKKLQSGWEKLTGKLVKQGWLPSFGAGKDREKKAMKMQREKKKHAADKDATKDKIGGKKPEGMPSESHPQHRHHHQQQQQHSTFVNTIPVSDDGDTEGGMDNMDLPEAGAGGRFQNKPQHKQKQSSSESERLYDEFWKQAEFDPDDYLLQDDFFHGDEYQWRERQQQRQQQRKRLRVMYGRLQRLTEDIFLAMDDDDIEELYEDWEDVEEDLGDELSGLGASEELRTWLTCQVRWWKSRVQRKKARDDNLIRGCGRLLMNWQLRAMCRPPQPQPCQERKCGRKDGARRERGQLLAPHGPLCRYLLADTVMSRMDRVSQGDTSVNPTPENIPNSNLNADAHDIVTPDGLGGLADDDKQLRVSRNDDGDDYHFDGEDVDDDDDVIASADETSANATAEDYYGDDDQDSKGETTWYFDRTRDRDDHLVSRPRGGAHHLWRVARPSSDTKGRGGGGGVMHAGKERRDADRAARWQFERAENRESHHHDGRWQFGRADERHLERTKPWYDRRSEHRADVRAGGPHYQGHPHHQGDRPRRRRRGSWWNIF